MQLQSFNFHSYKSKCIDIPKEQQLITPHMKIEYIYYILLIPEFHIIISHLFYQIGLIKLLTF